MGNLIKRIFGKKRDEKIDTRIIKFPQKTVDVRPIRERLEITLENSIEAEKRKQMELLYPNMPFKQQEDTFMEELANGLFSLGYERADGNENAIEDLLLDEKEIEILEIINNEKEKNIDDQADKYLKNNIYSFVREIKEEMNKSGKTNGKKPDIMKILNQKKKLKEKGNIR